MKKIISIFSGQKAKTTEGVLSPYINDLYRQAYYYTGTQHGAEDLLQDFFVYVCQRKEKLFELDPIKPWLMNCLYHRFIDSKRRQNARIEEVPLADDFDVIDGQEHHHEDLNEQIKASLQYLSEEQRAAISLFYIEDYDLAEVAEAMEIPEGTVKSHLHRGRKKLSEMLTIPQGELRDFKHVAVSEKQVKL